MNKKLVALLMATLFAVLFAFPAAADVSQNVAYNAGYTVLNHNYFYTTSLTKPSYYAWTSAKDINTETYYVDDYGNEYVGKHYTRVCSGTTVLTVEKTVNFGSTITFTSSDFTDSSYLVGYNLIRLKIRNGSDLGLGYKTKGTFNTTRSDQPVQ